MRRGSRTSRSVASRIGRSRRPSCEKSRPEFAPGQTWSYSNTGYLFLGNVIEAASGEGYFEFLRDRIFGPLGMHATRSSTPSDVIPNRASGYEWRDGVFENRSALTENAYAAGAIVSTARDLAKWEAALAGGYLLTDESRRAMWTAHLVSLGIPPFDYGLGWFLDTVHGGRVILHSGGTPGFSSVFHRFVGPGITVILLTNRGDRPLDHVARVQIAAFFAPSADGFSSRPVRRTGPPPLGARPRGRTAAPPSRRRDSASARCRPTESS